MRSILGGGHACVRAGGRAGGTPDQSALWAFESCRTGVVHGLFACHQPQQLTDTLACTHLHTHTQTISHTHSNTLNRTKHVLTPPATRRGKCDDALLECTNKNSLFKIQSRYVVERCDPELWDKVLDADNTYRRAAIDQARVSGD